MSAGDDPSARLTALAACLREIRVRTEIRDAAGGLEQHSGSFVGVEDDRVGGREREANIRDGLHVEPLAG